MTDRTSAESAAPTLASDLRPTVRLLGSVEVLSGNGVPFALGARQQRAVLAMLVLARGRPVSVDRLVDALWGDADPTRALSRLYPVMSKLRQVLGAGAVSISSVRSGYVLSVDSSLVDGFVFEDAAGVVSRLVAANRFGEAEAEAVNALGLWRGAALGEFAHESYFAADAQRWEVLRVGVMEDLFECRLSRSDAGLAADVERFVAEFPLRERAWALLLRALYVEGRQVEALRAFERVRVMLGEELGVSPGPELRDLERMILAHELPKARDIGPNVVPQDPTRDASHRRSATPRAAPSADPLIGLAVPVVDGGEVLLGRGVEVGVVESALDDAISGRPRCVVFSGDAGIGKSAMVGVVVAAAQARGFQVVQGFCDDDGTPPFGPWSQIMAGLGLGDVLSGVDGDASVLALPDDVDAAQRRLIDDVVARVRLLAVVGPLVVVVEDLHWADPSSLRCFEQLVRQVVTEQLLVVGTCRDGVSAGVSRLLGGLVRLPGFERVVLGGLSREEIKVAAGLQSGRALSAAELDVIERRTLGNPFFVWELVRSLGVGGRVDESVPLVVIDVVRRRLGGLPAQVDDVLTVAAVVGASFEVGLLAGVAGVELDAVFDVVDVAAEARLVESVGDVSGRFRFVHAIVRDALLEGLPPLRRARVHDRIAESLAVSGAVGSEVWVHRWEARSVAPAAARVACRDAALAAERAFATEDASRWWERALSLEPAGSAQRALLLLNHGRSLLALARLEEQPSDVSWEKQLAPDDLEGASRRPRSWLSLMEAIDLALESDDIAVAGAAAIAIGSGAGSWHWCGFRTDNLDVNARLEAVLARLQPGDEALRAAVLANLSIGHYNDPDPGVSDSLSADAVTIARQVQDDHLLAHVLLSRCLAIERPNRDDERLVLIHQTLELAATQAQRATALLMRAAILLRRGARFDAEIDVAEVKRIARRERLLGEDILAEIFDVTVAVIDGDIPRAEALAVNAIERGSSNLGNGIPLGFLGLFAMRVAQDRVGELEADSRRYAPLFAISAVDLVGPALLAQGLVADVAALAASPEAWSEPPFDWFWLSQNVLRAQVALGADNEALVQRQYEKLAPYVGLAVVVPGFAVHGLVDTMLGHLAMRLGHHQAAQEHYESAVEVGQSIGSMRWVQEAQRSLRALRDDFNSLE